jgi:anthranilate phosphoribosyltransferase
MPSDARTCDDFDGTKATARPGLLERFEETLRPDADLDRQVEVLASLNARRPDAAELAMLAGVLRRRCRRVPAVPEGAIDLCGTGGDRRGTFNVSTTASFVVAAAGIPVAKHGNRAVSSLSGSTDCLAELGVPVESGPEEASRRLREHGIAFLFAPLYHPAIAHAMPARRVLSERGERTVFNLLGPLANPARVRRQVVGVFSEDLVEPIAGALRRLGATRALVVHGGGLDEITLCGETRFGLVDGGRIVIGRLSPEALGLERCVPEDLAGGTPAENACTARAILEGRLRGPKRDIVLANAAAGILVGSKRRRGLAACLGEARRALDSGRALRKLELLTGEARHARRTGTDR